MNLPGLPEGVVAVRFGVTEPEEFGIVDGSIRGHRFAGLIVKAAPGYEFRYDVTTDGYKVGKMFSEGVRVVVEFQVRSESDLAEVRAAAKHLNGEIIAQWPSTR